MKAEDVMTKPVQCIDVDVSLVDAAEMMRTLDIGALPIAEAERLAGIITDRDIVVRAVADGRNTADTKVRDAMSVSIVYGYADQDVAEIAGIMEKYRIRRLPVVTRENQLVGMISTADLARATDPVLTGEVIHEVSVRGD